MIIGALCVQCLPVPNVRSMNICFKKIIFRFNNPGPLWSNVPFQVVVQCNETLRFYRKRLGV